MNIVDNIIMLIKYRYYQYGYDYFRYVKYFDKSQVKD